MSSPDANTRSDAGAIFRWIGAELAPGTRRRAIAGAILALLTRLAVLAGAWAFARGDTTYAIALTIASVGVLLGRRMLASATRAAVEADLHVGIARALLRADVLEELEGEPHFTLANGIYRATEVAVDTAPSLFAEGVATLAAAAVLVTVLPPRLLLTAGLAAAVIAVATVALRRSIARMNDRLIRTQIALSESFAATLHGRLELVASNQDPAALARVAEAAEAFRREATRSAFGVAILGRTPLAIAALLAAPLVAFGGDGLSLANASTGRLVLLATAGPIALSFVLLVQELLRARDYLRPFAEIVLRPERPNITRGRARPPADIARVALEGVSFAYRADTPRVLDALALAWERGVLVLKGPNGSGKSTILRLLLGLRDPDRGTIAIDGVDLAELDVRELRARSAFLPQRPYLGEPHETVADAFRILVPDATEEQMLGALERIGVRSVLARSGDDPLRLPVGELSVGQRQRIAIARVLLRPAALVLLDEPDANLDADGIARLGEVIAALGETSLVAIAAHGPIADSLAARRVCDLGER